MGVKTAGGLEPVRAARFYGAAAAFLLAVAAVPAVVFAQTLDGFGQQKAAPDARMLLEADTLIYNRDDSTVTAAGSVRIDYNGNKLVAKRVTYNRKTGRLLAGGDVEVIDPKGTHLYSDQIDVTDDFKDGFLNGLRVISPDPEGTDKEDGDNFGDPTVERNIYFGAESAERRGGFLTTFTNGVYTPCKPCEAHPEKAPAIRIKARKIIWNGQSKTIRFERARFEFFGYPLLQLPAFEIPDPSVKRKTGFLFPGIKQKSELGVGLAIPYYIALAPTYDLLLEGTGFTRQGFLGEAEWRQRFDNGAYKIHIAAINQLHPEAFDADDVDSEHTFRGMIGTTGQFAINERWAYGWDILAQTDKNFSKTYDVDGFTQDVHRSQIYLTGINDRNYFDLRVMHFDVQESAIDSDPDARQQEQPWVLPNFDYAYSPDEPVFGGELTFNLNAQALYRNNLDQSFFDDNDDGIADDANLDSIPDVKRVRGIDGSDARLTAEAGWRRTFYTPGGLVLTPSLDVRGDAIKADYGDGTIAAILSQADSISGRDFGQTETYGAVSTDINSSYYRAMATAGLEARWPILFSTGSASHIIEPMAQLFVRPNEPYAGSLGIPNEDAQSMVFDASNLFERDKFSGYDRIEGGTRANIGFRYTGSFAGGWTANSVFGQSFQLGGINSFAQPDLVNAGAFSGLETARSDYVGMVGVGTPGGLQLTTGGRFDETTFEVRRAELAAQYTTRPFSLGVQYAFIQAQPLYGFDNDRREVTLSSSKRFDENWRAYGSGTYDFVSDVMTRRSIGLAYDNDCFTYAVTYQQTKDTETLQTSENIGIAISFRTLGQFGTNPGVPEPVAFPASVASGSGQRSVILSPH